MCDKVAGSSPKGSRKGAMVKGGCFLPLKTRKALEKQGLNPVFKKRENLRSKASLIIHQQSDFILHYSLKIRIMQMNNK